MTIKGKHIPEKSLKDPCSCKKKCYEKFSNEKRQDIFNEFYNLSQDAQNQFVANHVQEVLKKTERLRGKDKESRRTYSRIYHLDRNLEKIQVCQIMFLSTLDLTVKKVRIIVEKKRTSNSNICPDDARGKHTNHPKISEEEKNIIRRHIEMFPSFESHYSREQTAKKYLASDLSISKMYKLYVEYCQDHSKIPRNEFMYRKIFVEEYNISFKKPYNDTCATCDKYELLLKSVKDVDEKLRIENQKMEHLNLADSACKEKRRDKLACKTNPNLLVVSFDLQKCLPTPYLKSSISFYKRKLWTLNLTIYETHGNTNSAKCYLWNETIAQRGGQEIASCLHTYINNVPPHINEIIMYSDCCPGQNKNILISVMLLILMEKFNRGQRQIFFINF